MQNRRSEPSGERPVGGAAVRWGVTGGMVLLALIGFLAGGSMVGVAFGIVAVFTINGVWLGAAEQAAGLLAMILAIMLSGVVGGMLEPIVASVGQTGGVVKQLVARGLAVLVVAVPLAIVLGVVLRSQIKKLPVLMRWNTIGGSVVGAAEGTLVALLAMWIPILLGPVATAQMQAAEAQRVGDDAAYAAAANASAPPQSLALAELVAGWEQALRGSILGGLAAATAPTKGAEIIALTTEFAEISRDDAAMNRLLEDPVMVELGELPSVQQAMDRLRHEPQVRAAIEGEAITPDRLWAILQSDEVTRVLDETGAMDDVSRRGALVAAAIARARE
ncbi:MAG: CvpA family protein [Planctomycetota bacterium]